jgi:hypothetical protein
MEGSAAYSVQAASPKARYGQSVIVAETLQYWQDVDSAYGEMEEVRF